MGALPKNKITRAERGKRRAGNKPTITKDTNSAAIPLHKRGMVAEFLKVMDIAAAKQTEKKTEQKPQTKQAKTEKPVAQKPAAKQPASQPTEAIKKSAPTKAVKPTAKKSAASRKSGTR